MCVPASFLPTGCKHLFDFSRVFITVTPEESGLQSRAQGFINTRALQLSSLLRFFPLPPNSQDWTASHRFGLHSLVLTALFIIREGPRGKGSDGRVGNQAKWLERSGLKLGQKSQIRCVFEAVTN